MSNPRIVLALAQINCTVGDLEGNAARILDYAVRARDAGADLVLTPELSLCGYPPEDLLLRVGFYRDCRRELDALAAKIDGIMAVVGFPEMAEDGKRYNAAAVIRDGRVVATARKHDLPNYEVFDEKRYFSAWNEPCILDIKGVRFGLTICEDVWWPEAPSHGQGGWCGGHSFDQCLALSQAQAGDTAQGLSRLDPRSTSADGLRESGRRTG